MNILQRFSTLFMIANALCSLMLSGCIGELDTESRVHDLRLLAIATTPAEVRLENIDLQSMNLPIQLNVLSPQLDDMGPRHYIITTCPDPEDGRCEGRDGEVLLDEGTFEGDEFISHIQFNINHLDLFQKALEHDPYYGFGGLPLTIALKITQDAPLGTIHTTNSSDNIVYGYKQLVFWLPVPGMSVEGEETNTNPLPPNITFNANEDDEAFVPWTSPIEINGLDDLRMDADGDLLDEARPEYRVPTFQGSELTLWESWTYEWFTTKGKFSPESTGGTNPVTNEPIAAQTKLTFSKDDEDGPFRGWCVKRDGRGGVSWTPFVGTLHRGNGSKKQ